MTLKLDDVVCHYRLGGETVRAVDGVSLTIERGELVALYGPSGSGKSTLLLIAAGLIDTDRGSVLWDGVQVPRDGPAATRWRREVLGAVFQEPRLYPGMPIGRSVGLRLEAGGMPPSRARERGEALLSRLGLADRIAHRPEQLSTGQRQRAAIATTLTTDPQLIVADEPTGNLDTKSGLAVMELLQSLAHEQQRAVLVVSHDPRLAAFADRVMALEDGRLATPPPFAVGSLTGS